MERKYPYVPFRPTEAVKQIIADIPYGEKSRFVNDCITAQAKAIGMKIHVEQDFQKNSNDSEHSQSKQTPSSESNNKSKNTDHSATQATVKSSPKPSINQRLQRLMRYGG